MQYLQKRIQLEEKLLVWGRTLGKVCDKNTPTHENGWRKLQNRSPPVRPEGELFYKINNHIFNEAPLWNTPRFPPLLHKNVL